MPARHFSARHEDQPPERRLVRTLEITGHEYQKDQPGFLKEQCGLEASRTSEAAGDFWFGVLTTCKAWSLWVSWPLPFAASAGSGLLASWAKSRGGDILVTPITHNLEGLYALVEG